MIHTMRLVYQSAGLWAIFGLLLGGLFGFVVPTVFTQQGTCIMLIQHPRQQPPTAHPGQRPIPTCKTRSRWPVPETKSGWLLAPTIPSSQPIRRMSRPTNANEPFRSPTRYHSMAAW